MALTEFTVGTVVRLAPDPVFPRAVWSDTEWKVLAVYHNGSGPWAVGEMTKGTKVGTQTPLEYMTQYELVPEVSK